MQLMRWVSLMDQSSSRFSLTFALDKPVKVCAEAPALGLVYMVMEDLSQLFLDKVQIAENILSS